MRTYEPPRFFEAFLRAGPTPSRRTSPRGSAGSARWPTNCPPVRAGDPQPRPGHLLLGAFPRADNGSTMKVVIGIGNPHRRDDGVGPALAERLARIGLSDVDVRVLDGEPTG